MASTTVVSKEISLLQFPTQPLPDLFVIEIRLLNFSYGKNRSSRTVATPLEALPEGRAITIHTEITIYQTCLQIICYRQAVRERNIGL